MRRARLPFVTAAILGAACGDGGPATDPSPGEPAAWTRMGPRADIGVADGEAHYALSDVTSAVRLEDGRVLLLDAASAELRIYDSEGVFLARAGGRGEGPGEFRRPGHLQLTHPDSLLVDDPVLRRTSRFDTAGRFVWAESWPDSDETFPRRTWLYGRHLVEGPYDPSLRGPVRRALDALPAPPSDGYRRVIVDPQWRLWIHVAGTAGSATERGEPIWRVYDLEGNALGRIVLPAGFEPTHIGPDFVVGVATDSMNLEHVQVWGLGGVPEERPVDAASFAEGPEPEPPPRPSESSISELQAVLRSATAAQEAFYSDPANGSRYADRIERLELDPAALAGAELHIVKAGPRGYTMLAFHEREAAACALTVGVGGPPGWAPGRALCP